MSQVHRFGDTAAIGGQYVTAHDARRLAQGLLAIADSIEREDFSKSPSLTVSVDGFENVTDLHKDKGEVTHVNFRIWPESEGGDVIALFVLDPGNPTSHLKIESYQHLGQHSDAVTCPAKPLIEKESGSC